MFNFDFLSESAAVQEQKNLPFDREGEDENSRTFWNFACF